MVSSLKERSPCVPTTLKLVGGERWCIRSYCHPGGRISNHNCRRGKLGVPANDCQSWIDWRLKPGSASRWTMLGALGGQGELIQISLLKGPPRVVSLGNLDPFVQGSLTGSWVAISTWYCRVGLTGQARLARTGLQAESVALQSLLPTSFPFHLPLPTYWPS